MPKVRLDPFARLRPVFAFAASVEIATGAVLPRRLRRRRSLQRRWLRLLLEAVTVVGLTAAAGAAIYVWKGPKAMASPWRIAGTHIQDVSRARGVQTEVAVAVFPTKPNVVIAASNDSLLRTIRIHTSTDGGRSWSSSAGPSLGADACARGEPSVTSAPDGRQYAAFIVNGFCTDEDPFPYLVVAARAGPGGKWIVHRVVKSPPESNWDDKPALAAAPDGRVYVAWSRLLSWTHETTVISSTSNGGRSWSSPHLVDRRLDYPQLVSATVSPRGTLYVAGLDARFGIWIARSDDGGRRFRLRRVARLPGNRAASCANAGIHPIPFQATRCLGPNPTVVATARRVFVTYGVGWVGEAQSVHIGVLDPALHVLWRGRVGPGTDKADQFWPTAAVDLQTGQLWTCFYDTSGDPSRKRAWLSCTVSRDGRRWTTPVRAARAPANAEVLWEDARIFGFGDVIGYGGYPGLAVADGTAYALWVDTRNVGGRDQEIFGATLRAARGS